MRTLFVDFDGTICHDRFWRSLAEKEYELVQQTLFRGGHSVVRDWMRGLCTSEFVNDFVSKQTGIPYEQLWDVFVSDCESMRVEAKLLELLVELRPDYHLVLITGNMDCFDRFTLPALKLDQYFDVIVNSSNEGQLKSDNDGETFKKYVKGDLKEAILIEDSEKSCAVFTAIGGTALRVVTKNATAEYFSKLLAGKRA